MDHHDVTVCLSYQSFSWSDNDIWVEFVLHIVIIYEIGPLA